MATTVEAISRMVPSEYHQSRDIDQVKKTWDPILRQEMGRHWRMIKEGMKGFAMAHDGMLKVLARYERDETAELICREFLENVYPGALDVLAQIGPVVDQYPSCDLDTPDMNMDDSDARSVTMAPEPSSSGRSGPSASMGPPPRPFALMVPEFAPATRGEMDVCDEEDGEGKGKGKGRSLVIYDVPDSPPAEGTSHGPLTLQLNGKRSLDTTAGAEAAGQASDAPNKKAKKANAAARTIDMWDVDGVEYIFRDKRCGPGYYVIRCNLEKNPPLGHPGVFVRPPLEGSTALDHFNSKGHTCHDTTRRYGIEDIIREFAHRVTGEGVIAQKVKEANWKLQKYWEQNAAEGPARRSPKGKEKAAGFLANNRARGARDDSDDPFGDEEIREVISGFLANPDDVDFEFLDEDDD